jgi:hypothetical protein
MTSRAVVFLCVAGVCALSACAAHPPDWKARPNWARLGNTSKADDATQYYRDPHHQYFDRQHQRYYYYDPDKKSFFWENGVPKT